ncbi:hypothetical protein ES703_69300 [subsurface metagenome]
MRLGAWNLKLAPHQLDKPPKQVAGIVRAGRDLGVVGAVPDQDVFLTATVRIIPTNIVYSGVRQDLLKRDRWRS